MQPAKPTAAAPASLLAFLDTLVHADRAPAGMYGRVAVGVSSRERVSWWRVLLGDKVLTEFSDTRPEFAEVTVIVGELAALEMLGQPVPSDARGDRSIWIHGDRRLLERFMERYLKKQSLLDLRLSLGRQGPTAGGGKGK
jgi:hypothetical protein